MTTAKQTYRLRIGKHKEKEIIATPHQAARQAARFAARGTLVRTKGMWDQPEDMQLPEKTTLVDDHGAVLMTCAPSVVSTGAARAGRRVKYSFARCTIKPAFKKLIHKTKRKKR
jgi:hypothetical protein